MSGSPEIRVIPPLGIQSWRMNSNGGGSLPFLSKRVMGMAIVSYHVGGRITQGADIRKGVEDVAKEIRPTFIFLLTSELRCLILPLTMNTRTRDKMVTVRLSQQEYAGFKKFADRLGLPLARLMRLALADYILNNERREK